MYPKLLSIGSFYIPTYGVLVALGFLAGLLVTMRLATKAGLSAEKVTNLAVYCAIAGVLGAKLFMFLFDFGDYLHNPGEIFTMSTCRRRESSTAALLPRWLSLCCICAGRGSRYFPPWTFSAPAYRAGPSHWAAGLFAAGCCWGRECDLPWGVRFRSDFAAPVPSIKRFIRCSFMSRSRIFSCLRCSTNCHSENIAPAK